jgi:hypothetical protein
MGAGNPSIRSLDNDRYSPITYFLDMSSDLEEFKKSYKEENDDEDISDERAYEWMAEQDSESIFDLFYEFCCKNKLFEYKYNSKTKEFYEKLASGFNQYGIILCESKYCWIVTTTEWETGHFPFALIPSFTYDDIYNTIYYNEGDKITWYDKRNLSYDVHIDKLATKEYDKKLKLFHKEEKTFWNYFVNEFGDDYFHKVLSQRGGPWTSFHLFKDSIINAYNLKKKYLKKDINV